MAERRKILAGMAGGLVWAVAVIFAGLNGGGGFLPPPLAIPGALIGPGLVMIAMIALTVFLSFFVPSSSFFNDSRRSASANNLTS